MSVHDREAEVEVRGKRFRSQMSDLRVVAGAAKIDQAPVRVTIQLQPRETQLSGELLLVGKTVDEAIDRLEKFLDESLLGEQRMVRVIHGFGTGRLKEAVVSFLQSHPLVTTVRTASLRKVEAG